MRTGLSFAAGIAALVLASCASAEGQTADLHFNVTQPNASVSQRDLAVRSWAKDDSILVQTFGGQWYRATLMTGCPNRGWGAIGFLTQSGDIVDRGSSAILQGQTCRFATFDKIDPPPEGARA